MKSTVTLLEMLSNLEKSEQAVEQLYGACAQRWPGDQSFWEALAVEEKTHAANLHALAVMVEAAPAAYAVGRPIQRAAVQSFIDYIRASERRLSAGELTVDKMLFIARDIEAALIESRYIEAVRTEEPRALAIMERIEEETIQHKKRIEEKIRGLH